MKALVTGASSGIGRDIAIYLSKKGYDLFLVAQSEKELNEVKQIIKTKATVLIHDLSIAENVYQLYDEVKDQNIDIVINGAGFGLFGNADETDLNKELKMIDLNIKAVHILTKLFLKDFVKRNSGYIMNIASAAGFMAGPKLNTYYATKNYVLKYTLAIYEELREKNRAVHICALCPGPVATKFNRVAGGDFAVKGISSSYVAQYAVDKMFKNKLIIIPSFTVKLGVFLNRFLPYKWSLRVVSRIQQKKNK